MHAFGAVAARPLLGSAEIGRLITELHHGLFRSAVAGQANAILVRRGELRPLRKDSIVLNPPSFRRAQARALGLDRRIQLAWAKERRVCHAVRVSVGERFLTVANLHDLELSPTGVSRTQSCCGRPSSRRVSRSLTTCSCSPATSTSSGSTRRRSSCSPGPSGVLPPDLRDRPDSRARSAWGDREALVGRAALVRGVYCPTTHPLEVTIE